jgi:arylsulfatase
MSYATPWANASNTPFRLYKHYIHEGGISTPLIAHWPAGIHSPGRITTQVGHVMDIMVTCVDVAAADYPAMFNGEDIFPPEGQSLRPAFTGEDFAHFPIGWEHHGNRGYREGKWKLVASGEEWELYDMEADRTELTNLAAVHPGITRAMIAKYEQWASRVGVVEW